MYNDLVNMYSVSKTLRFRLIPQYETEQNMQKNEVVKKDTQRDESFKILKRIIDDYHRVFIENTLSKTKINWDCLVDIFDKKELRNDIEITQAYIRKQIAQEFIDNDVKKLYNGKSLLEEVAKGTLDKSDCSIIKEFSNSSTLLTGFNENRQNIYSSEGKATSIAYRVVNENFPKMYKNLKNYYKLMDKHSSFISEVISSLQIEGFKKSAEEYFSNDGFNLVLTQSGIDEYNQIVGDFNAGLNLYTQKLGDSKIFKQNKMSFLYKQILSEGERPEFITSKFMCDNDILDSLKTNHETIKENLENTRTLVKIILSSDDEFELKHGSENYFSHKLYTDYSVINHYLYDQFFEKYSKKDKLSQKNSKIFSDTIYTVGQIKTAINALKSTYTDSDISCIIDLFNSELEVINHNWQLFQDEISENIKLKDSVLIIDKMKTYLDGVNNIRVLLSKFVPNEKTIDTEQLVLYQDITNIYEMSNVLYNKVRDYITQRNQDKSKIKLNFDSVELANGWDVNKEKSSLSIILMKDNNYYLGIYNKNNKKGIDFNEDEINGNYKKMVYKQMSGMNKMIPKCTNINKVKDHFKKSIADYMLDSKEFIKPLLITYEIYDILTNKKFSKEEVIKNNSRVNMDKWIEFCKEFTKCYKSCLYFDYSKLKETSEYADMKDFYSDLDRYSYSISFIDVAEDRVRDYVKNNQLYLFQIYSKDFSPNSTGNQNLHTLYFKALFDEYNLSNGIFKLNGGAEIFVRNGNKKNKITHAKGSVLVNKTLDDGQTISNNLYVELSKYLNKKIDKNELSNDALKMLPHVVYKESKIDIIKDKRFINDQYFFHFPITINYKANDLTDRNMNEYVNHIVCNSDKTHILGIDRGEKNLIYVTLINQKKEIVLQKSFNIVEESRNDGKTRKVNYHEKLDLREKERDEARKSWKTIETIKEIKEGYLSSVVYEICKLIVKYNAIVVMEDLNGGFKRKRTKVEKQVYQKFELMLIKKLNCLSFKGVSADHAGSIYHPYQLATRIKTYDSIKGQSGIIYYVNASYTSKIDPTTGFINAFDHKAAQRDPVEFIRQFEEISYIRDKEMFKFVFDYDNFSVNVTSHQKYWEIYTNGDRLIHRLKNQHHEFEKVALTEKLRCILDENKIEYLNCCNLVSTLSNDKKIAKTVMTFFFNIIQMRNMDSKNNDDYIISPVINKEGSFFDSRNSDPALPIDSDANGAYHIALKGLLLLSRYQNDSKFKIAISNEEWFEFMQRLVE